MIPGTRQLAPQLVRLDRSGPGLDGGDPDGHWPLADRAHLASNGCHSLPSRVNQPEGRDAPLLHQKMHGF